MKRIMKMLAFFAVAAMGLTACQNDIEEKIEAKESVVVTFVADSAAESRTSVDTSGDVPVFAWGNNETFAVLEQTTSLASATNVEYAKDDEGKATITATFDHNAGQSEYKYVAVYPLSGYYESDSESIYAAKLYLSNNQTMYSDASYDPNADLMVSKVVTTAAQPTEAQYLQFTRLAAVAKMSIKGVEGTIEKVIFTANGKNIAGTINADLENIANEDGTHNFVVAEGSSDTITIDGAVNNGAVYFTLLPTTLEAGEGYTVTIITEDKIYAKKGTIPEGKSLQFAAGMVTRFSVNMEGVVAGDKWMLVRDVNELEAGDIVTFAAANYDFVLGCYVSTNFPYASYNTDIVKAGDYLYHPVVTDKSKYQYMIQPLVVVKSDESVAAFDFYNGVDYEGDTKTGYLTNVVTNNYLVLNSYPSVNSLFYTTIDDNGVASLYATDSEFTNKDLKFYNYNPKYTTSTYRRFVCIDSEKIDAEKHDDVCIYKKVGAKGVVPTAGAVVTVPEEEEPVVIGKEGAEAATEIAEVKFSYVGDWTISVSDNADWLTLNYADEKLSYTATANADAKREATVTITASHDGEEDLTWSFDVVQKGEPQIATVAEFIGKSADLYAEYIVTGRLTKKATSHSGSTTVADLNDDTKVATFVYIDNKDGKTFFDNSDDVELGDIVQFVAPVTSSKTGGSKAIHTIFNGYYNLSATTNVDHVAYSGGEVTVTINKEGNLTPQTITGTVNGSFATVTPNGDKFVVKLAANEGAPREVVATFTDGLATTSVAIVQGADTSKGNTWELVTDATTLEAGDKVIIAAKDYDVAMSTTIASDRRSEIAVTKLGNYYITPAVGVQTLVLGAGSVDGTFAFYDADHEGFLVSSNTSAELVNQVYVDENASFAITIEDGAATIANKEGDYSSNKMSYYINGDNKYFCSSNKTTTYYKPLSLYRLVGVKGEIPVVAADVTANDAVISEDAAVSATPIPEVVFNYVGDWDITATTDAEWITSLAFDKANNCLTYTAEANLGAVRETTVTITATLAGQTDITWEFNLLQKGFIPKMTIAEYIAIPEEDMSDNVYVRYELTGRIESIESTSATSSKFTITDGTESVQVYGLVVENSDKDYGDLNLKVGDVVTITAPRIANCDTAGKGSTNPAYYISHYNIEATATAAEYTAGSTATISIATTSGLDVTYEMGDCDFATISYTTDPTSENTTATVTFTSTNEAEAARSVDVTFKTGLASTTVTVTQKIDPAKVKGWVLVTDASELAIGDEVIIVAKNANYALGCFTSTHTSNANFKKSEVVINGNSISSEEVNSKDVQKFTLVEGYSEGTVAFEFDLSGTTYYMYYTTGGLKMNSSKTSNSRAWTIDVAADGEATITSKSSSKVVRFNYVSSSGGFSTYSTTADLATDAQAAISIYKNTEKE